jgi:homoserine O-acetyltransferase
MTVERDVVALGSFEFECGESIPELDVAYEAHGEFTGDNAVLLCHALTGSHHVATPESEHEPTPPPAEQTPSTAGQADAWWDDVVGPGQPIDTDEFFVVCVNVPGSCYGTTGPASTNPETGEPYGPDFPPVTVTDWTRCQRRLLAELGVSQLHAVVGGSVGGMNVLDWAKQYPERVERLVPIATAARLDSQCLALDAIARRAITTDPNWQGGDYYGRGHPDDGLALARQLGHLAYRSKSSMERQFGRTEARQEPESSLVPDDPGAAAFPYRDVESYLDYQSSSFVERFDANAYLALTRAMDAYDLADGAASDADALAAFEGEALVLSFTGDWHFTVDQARSLATALREADADVVHDVVDSDYGHDAFLVETDRVGSSLATFLGDGIDGLTETDDDAWETETGVDSVSAGD